MKIAVVSLLVLMVLGVSAAAQEYAQWGLPEGAKLRIGRGEMSDLKYSPDGSRFAVASSIGIWIYDTMSLREIALYAGRWTRPSKVAFSGDGKLLAIVGVNRAILLLDAETGEEIRRLEGHTDNVVCVDFRADGRLLASGSRDRTVRIWDVDTGGEMHVLTGHEELVTAVAFNPSENTVASGGFDKTLRLWDSDTGKQLHTVNAHTSWINSLAFSSDGETLASGAYDQTIRLWDPVTWELRRIIGGQHSVTSVAYSIDGRNIASGSERVIRLWDAKTGLLRRTLPGHGGRVLGAVFSPDGKTVASVGNDDSVRFWDAVTGEHKRTLTWIYRDFMNIAFSPDGRTIATGNEDRTARLWDAVTGEHLQTFDGHRGAVYSLAFGPHGGTLASGSSTEIRLWDVNTGRLRHTLGGLPGRVASLVFSPDGEKFASGGGEGDFAVRLWDSETAEQLHELMWHVKPVNGVAFSSDGAMLASASSDGTVALWDTSTGEHKQTLVGHTDGLGSVTFGRDEKTLVSSTNTQMRIWDTTTGESESIDLQRASGFGNPAFSADASLFAVAHYANVWLLDVASGERISTFSGHTEVIRALALSPNGRALASASHDGTVLLWDVTPSPPGSLTMRISPSSVTSPPIGEHLRLSLDIEAGEDVAGFQATVHFDTSALRFAGSEAGDYLPAGSFFVPPVENGNRLTFGGTSLEREIDGDGVLATFTFEVLSVKSSIVELIDASLVDLEGKRWLPRLEGSAAIEPTRLDGDVNRDGDVNVSDLVLIGENFTKTGENDADVNGDGVVDILDLVQVASILAGANAAPPAYPLSTAFLKAVDVQNWLTEARGLRLADPTSQRGIRFLDGLLAALTPKETMLLPSYPNPFNPETWIPYSLARESNVTITIYDAKGTSVRRLALGYQPEGHYAERGKAAYWDGRNERGEAVASGIYIYRFRAGDYAASRRMAIVK
ncbi:MAG: cohesin domain-containing protein [Candidatus Poribacteria bacterium]|nr:cohesin domain-containing protein [Candidatus Poribacteria bacterium]MDE0505973.1 cohesin domain-containing protein [Candidatus Poribacteria bacterium]